jgi:hypothetical protein
MREAATRLTQPVAYAPSGGLTARCPAGLDGPVVELPDVQLDALCPTCHCPLVCSLHQCATYTCSSKRFLDHHIVHHSIVV